MRVRVPPAGPMYYIIYEDYTEWNQFEGEWSIRFNKFDNLEDAKRFRDSCNQSHYIRNVSPVLIEHESI